MKKLFTLALALLGYAGVANAASTNDIAVCKHSYVLVCDDYTNNGTAGLTKGDLFGDNHFLAVKNLSAATNKGAVDLSIADGIVVTEEMAQKYGEYGSHLNSLRIKNGDDCIQLKLTDGSKVIVLADRNNTNRYPELVDASTGSIVEGATTLYDCSITDVNGKSYNVSKLEVTVQNGGTYNIIAHSGSQIFVSYVIVEANEAPGTPTVKVGEQTFENGLWFREVTCRANDMVEVGSTDRIPTIVTYTTDGTAPTAASPIYSEPIKCYQNMTVKFQAFMNLGDGKPADDFICDNADNEGNVNFVFSAPTISADGAVFTITSPYAEQNGENYYKLNNGDEVKGDGTTLTESASVTAYTKITNGSYTTFTTQSTSKDVYVLNPIKTKKTIAVTNADVVLDEEATATSTTGEVYKVENGEISADKADFFVKNLSWGVVKDAQYQIDGKEAYIKMSDTNITFQVAAGDEVNVKVICSKNSCKQLPEEGKTEDLKCYVNVSGTTYGHDDITAEGGNIIEFSLKGGKTVKQQSENDVNGDGVVDKNDQEEVFVAEDTYYTFQKYSGTGNILISSIEIEPVAAAPAETETVLWEGSVLVNGWTDQPNLLSDGGAELTAAGAKAGDKLRIYGSAPDTKWQVEIFDGHWHNNYQRFSEEALTNEDGSARESIVVPLSTQGYFDFTLTDAFLTDVSTAAGWGGTFLLNGDGNLTVTKVSLIQGGATGIEAVKSLKVVNKGIFNLAGQRVGANYKGVVIVNGKKMIQK